MKVYILGISSIRNRNEEQNRILDFAAVKNLCLITKFYEHRESPKWA